MSTHSLVRRLTKNALMLALLCVVGMFSIPLGDNIKVSLQLLIVMIICLSADGVVDCIIVTGCYLGLGLFAPVYAGFSSGISPTFGFVISFVVASPVYYFMNKLPIRFSILRMAIACFTGLIVVYAIGAVFLMLYLNLEFGKSLMISVVPYIPFDLIKIALAIAIIKAIPDSVLHPGKKKAKMEESTNEEEPHE